MRSKFAAFFSLIVFTVVASVMTAVSAPNAFAVSSGAKVFRFKYSAQNVTTTAYALLTSQTTKGMGGVSLMNSGTNPVELAFGVSGSEVVQVVVPGSMTTPVYFPLQGAYGIQLGVIALDGTNTVGEFEMNLFYN